MSCLAWILDGFFVMGVGEISFDGGGELAFLMRDGTLLYLTPCLRVFSGPLYCPNDMGGCHPWSVLAARFLRC